MFQASVYKPNQGRIVRQLTVLAIWVVVAFGCWRLYASLNGNVENAYIVAGVPLGLLVGGLWPVIMGTVSSNLFRPYLPKAEAKRYEKVYEQWKAGNTNQGLQLANKILAETPGRHQASTLENGILRKLASQFSYPLVDVQSLVAENEPHGIPGETLFDDHCHLNEGGRAIWMNGYVPQIIRHVESNLTGNAANPASSQNTD